jgi:2-oxoglutarate dehydrogenase E2 component (dihydrolipoamide succinyltransferase)
LLFELKVPNLGESITTVEIGQWSFAVGDVVEKDAILVEIESEKATVEVPCPETGVLKEILKQTGKEAAIDEIIARLDNDIPAVIGGGVHKETAPTAATQKSQAAQEPIVMPAARRVLGEAKVQPAQVEGTGPGGRILKEDALSAVSDLPSDTPSVSGERLERVERMSPLRRTIAARLVKAKQEAALLTTFNEVDMSAVKGLRSELGDKFLKVHEIKLGFMSFFIKAAVESLKHFPKVNGEIRGDNLVYHDYFDVGIAVGSGKGLVVPVIRDADKCSFARLETIISDFGKRAKAGRLTPSDLEGGTFTISNGGIYGSMLSTPIINPPQSAILGLHAIKDRPVVVDGQIVIRPVMYLALSYDHRLVDGREAVTFLKEIKESIENPARMLLEV